MCYDLPMTIKTLINGDCLEVADQITDKSIDLVLTDPPYNISVKVACAEGGWIDPVTGENKNKIHSHDFSKNFEEAWDVVDHDAFLLQMKSWSDMWFKKIRPGGSFLVFISDQYVSYLWKIMETSGFEPKRIWTWKKPAAVPFNRKVNPVSGCEYALWGVRPGGKRTFNANASLGSKIERYALADKISSIVYKMVKDSDHSTDLRQIFERARREAEKMMDSRRVSDGLIECVIPNTITFSGGGGERIHPTQKPIELLEYFIELLTKEGDTVLDTFGGSGSTGVAAQNLGRNFILIERDKIMFEKMKNRLTPDNNLTTLFDFEEN